MSPAISASSMSVGDVGGPFEDGGQALAAAEAHGLQAVAGLAAVEFAQQGGEDAAAGGADGVAQRDAGTVDVESCEVGRGQVPGAGTGEHLGGACLVEFDQVDVGELQALPFQGPGGGGRSTLFHRPTLYG